MDRHEFADILSKLNTPDGKRLLELMNKDGGAAFVKAAAAAKSGDYRQAINLISPVINGTDAAALAQKMANKDG